MRALAMMERTPALRPRLIKYALFQSYTGKRLIEVFGDDCKEWVWDNASPQIGDKPSACFPADMRHIKAVLSEHKPEVVLAFGRVAAEALQRAKGDFRLITGPHPAARHDDVMNQLKSMRENLNDS